MSRTHLLRLALGVAALLALWGLLEILGGEDGALERVALAEGLDAAGADTIAILGPDDTVRLVRDPGGGWTVNGHEASAAAVAELLAALADSLEGELVARNPVSHARMGVDSVRGTHLRVAGGGSAIHLVAGERGRPFQSRYLRPAGDDRVFLVQGPAIRALDRSVTDWREKRIAAVEPDSVARIVVERRNRGYALTRQEDGWELDDGSPADTAAVRRVLEGYRALAAQGSAFATPAQADSADFASPERRVALLSAAGDTLLGLLFDSTDTGYWVRRADGVTVYQLYRWKVDEIAPADTALRRPGG